MIWKELIYIYLNWRYAQNTRPGDLECLKTAIDFDNFRSLSKVTK